MKEGFNMSEDIQFLKDLQKELNNQDNDCQASPRFWTVEIIG